MSTSCINPGGSTLSPKNPRRWALTGSNFSLPMPILSNADAKMMLAELPLSTRTLCTVFFSYDDTYYQGIVKRMLTAFHVGVRKNYGGV